MVNEIFKDMTQQNIRFYIFEKSKVNVCDDKTKDGIHILINIICDYATKMLIRDYIIKNLPDIWDDLPLKNSCDVDCMVEHPRVNENYYRIANSNVLFNLKRKPIFGRQIINISCLLR